jgi:hypothetical protein
MLFERSGTLHTVNWQLCRKASSFLADFWLLFIGKVTKKGTKKAR